MEKFIAFIEDNMVLFIAMLPLMLAATMLVIAILQKYVF